MIAPAEIARVVADIYTVQGVLKNMLDHPEGEWSVLEWGSNTSVHFTSGPNETVVITVMGVREELQ